MHCRSCGTKIDSGKEYCEACVPLQPSIPQSPTASVTGRPGRRLLISVGCVALLSPFLVLIFGTASSVDFAGWLGEMFAASVFIGIISLALFRKNKVASFVCFSVLFAVVGIRAAWRAANPSNPKTGRANSIGEASKATESPNPLEKTAQPGAAIAQFTFTSTDGKFAVSFPGNPTTDERRGASKENDFVFHNFTFDAGTIAYSVSYTDAHFVAPSASDNLSRAARGVAGGNRIVKRESTTQQGYPALILQLEMSGSADSQKSIMWTKLIVVDKRLYQVAIISAASDPAPDEEVMRYFSSFRLLK